MVTLLEKLARATDTKGYPDDKNPAHWRKINGSPVHLDANGNIDGGAGGKFGGKAWKSTKHPHIPASYPKPKTTLNDLKTAWAKVAKYHVAMKRAKTQATHQKQQQNMLKAISDYQNLAKQADPKVAAQFKPNVALAQKNASAQFGQQSQPQSQPKTQQPQVNAQQNPLQTLASATAAPKGRNVKIYNLSKKGPASLISYARSIGLNVPAAVRRTNDANAIGKWVANELNERNKNYGSMTAAQAKKMTNSAFLNELKKTQQLGDKKLNNTLSNDKFTQIASMKLGLNNPPKVVSKKEFDDYIKKHPNAPVLYRGVRNDRRFSSKDFSDDLKYGDATWLGGSACLYGVGLYFASNKTSEARARQEANGYGGRISRGCIDMTKAKTIKWDDVQRKYNVTVNQYLPADGSTQRQKQRRDAFTALAIKDGYNLIVQKGGGGGSTDYLVVLDRSILIMQKEDA